MYLIYSALLAVGLLIATPYWLLEMLRHGKYRKGLLQRLGKVPMSVRDPHGQSIWVHAVSVGEVLAVSELIGKLRVEFPQHRILISTTTDTGQALASKRFGAGNVFYFPLDFSFAMRRYLAAIRPDLVVIAETEFWPNFLRLARDSGAQVAVVNARISDRSFPGYRRWKKILRPVLQDVSLFVAQTSEDARRLMKIGAPEDRVAVAGNLKFDFVLPPAPQILGKLRSSLAESGAGPVLVCGSTVDGEETILLDVFKDVLAQYPSAVMLLAPRHPERFGQVVNLLQESNLKFWLRTQWGGSPLNGSVLLVDSIGELANLYALADLTIIGGSFVPTGGHNILEPAQHGVPIVVGPHTENFRDIVNLFRSRDAVLVINATDLAKTVSRLLADRNERQALGRAALQTLQSKQGATAVTLQKLKVLLSSREQEAHTA
jgi:3-deoxy-D-manno-octulosonic-acid transferase